MKYQTRVSLYLLLLAGVRLFGCVSALLEDDSNRTQDLLALSRGAHGLQTAFCALQVTAHNKALSRAFLLMETTVGIVVYLPCLWLIYQDYLYGLPSLCFGLVGLGVFATEPADLENFEHTRYILYSGEYSTMQDHSTLLSRSTAETEE